MKNKITKMIKNSFEKIILNSKRKPNLFGTDRGKKFYKIIFQNLLNNSNTKRYSKNTSLGAVFAERFNHTIRNLLKGPVSEKGNGTWIVILPKITKQNTNRVHSSTKLTPIQASFKNNEGFAYNSLLDKR